MKLPYAYGVERLQHRPLTSGFVHAADGRVVLMVRWEGYHTHNKALRRDVMEWNVLRGTGVTVNECFASTS